MPKMKRLKRSSIDDEQLKGLVFLVHQICKEYFHKDLTSIVKHDYMKLEEEMDGVISEETIERIFNLARKDVDGYRPRFSSVNPIVFWFYDNRVQSFKAFCKDYRGRIEAFFNDLDYQISTSNPLPSQSAMIDLNKMDNFILLGNSGGNMKKLISLTQETFGDIFSVPNKKKLPNDFSNNATLKRLYKKEQKRTNNLKRIIANAKTFVLQQEENNNELDEEWIDNFFNLAQDITNKGLQYLWGKLLAEEIDRSRCFSRRTLNILKQLSSTEAQLFTQFCACVSRLSYSKYSDDLCMVVEIDRFDEINDQHWGFDTHSIDTLAKCGLAKSHYSVFEKGEVLKLNFFDQEYSLTFKAQQKMNFLTLTDEAEQLLPIVHATPNRIYFKDTLRHLKKYGSLEII